MNDPPAARRIEAVDELRGVVMALMALDHTRDFFGAPRIDPTDLTRTTIPLFLTRWVTHFCAPVFVMLAGTSAYLWKAAGSATGSGRSSGDLAGFLATRGLWLVALEVTVVRVPWFFELSPRFVALQVIWAIGASMLTLALLVRLPPRWVGAVGAAMIAGHNLLDHTRADSFGALRPAWLLLHETGALEYGAGRVVYVAYPLVPWIGVMAVGYGLGPLVLSDPEARRKKLAWMGAALVALFVVVRGLNVYGDPRPWSVQGSFARTVLSFLNCSKYPPSLSYLAMTLGPALLGLAALDRFRIRASRPIAVFGKVPLFYYVGHLYLLRAGAIALDAVLHGHPRPALLHGGVFALPADYGYALPVVYVTWVVALGLLFPGCVWFARVKSRHRGAWWVSYV